MNPEEKALMIIEAIRNELDMGTQHFNLKGDLITDVKVILQLLRHNQLQIIPVNPERFGN